MIEVSITVNGRDVPMSERKRAMVMLVLAAERLDEFESGTLELHFKGGPRASVQARLKPVLHVAVDTS